MANDDRGYNNYEYIYIWLSEYNMVYIVSTKLWKKNKIKIEKKQNPIPNSFFIHTNNTALPVIEAHRSVS